MNIKEIKLMVENGGCELNKKHLEILFNHIELTNSGLKRIAKISQANTTSKNRHNRHEDFHVIEDIANAFIIEQV